SLPHQSHLPQNRYSDVAPAYSLQVIQVKCCCVLDGLAVSGQFFAGLNDRGEFTRGQTYRLAAVALECYDLAGSFCFRLGFGLEKLSASIKRTEIEIPGMRFAVAIFEDSKGWPLHSRNIRRSG